MDTRLSKYAGMPCSKDYPVCDVAPDLCCYRVQRIAQVADLAFDYTNEAILSAGGYGFPYTEEE